jgi:hypothetical protein
MFLHRPKDWSEKQACSGRRFPASLFTVAALDYPFKGDVRIHPAAFEQVLERFQESKLSDLWERRVGAD